jgi:hypothetical protein
MPCRAVEAASACAWRTYLSVHQDVDQDDDRRITLDRYVTNLWDAGEHDPDALQAAGLVYLRKLDQLGQEWEARHARYKALEQVG